MPTATDEYKSREVTAKWSGAELFAYAKTHGFSSASPTRADPGRTLRYSMCYGCGYSDTKFWVIPFALDDAGFPLFDDKAKETLAMLLAGEHVKQAA